MRESKLDFNEERIIAGCCTEEQVEAEIIKRIQNGLKVDGIFGRNDRLACVAMSAVKK